MMRVALVLCAFTAVLYFPWPIALGASVLAASVVPLVPLAAGILADTLYLAPHATAFPLASIIGAMLALAAFLARLFLEARIMRA